MDQGGIVVNKHEQYRHQIVTEFIAGKIKRREASLLLGIRERSVSRIAARIRSRGLAGIKHGNTGRRPVNRIPGELRSEVLRIVRERYYDFNLTHALEKLRAEHGIQVQYESFRKWCHAAGLVKQRHKRRGRARVYRDRMPQEGMLLQLDGSPHRWCGDEQVWTLISAIDDATSDIPYAEFFHAEDTINCLRVLHKIIERRGLPECLYVDRAGIFGGAKRQHFSQFARACEELGIRVLFASSPQGKGRIERSFRTIQDRLVPEMRLRNIHRMSRANEFLQAEFLPNYWQQAHRVPARVTETRYRMAPGHEVLREALCVKEWRSIAADQTVQLHGRKMLVDLEHRYSLKGQKVEIRTYTDCSHQTYFAGRPVDLLPVEKPLKIPA